MPRKRKTRDTEILAPVPNEALDQFVREGPLTPAEVEAATRQLYARGLTVREIQAFLLEMYAVDVSPDLISTVTDAVVAEVTAWQTRPLEALYPVVFFTRSASRSAMRARSAAKRSIWRSACWPTARATFSACGSSRPKAPNSG